MWLMWQRHRQGHLIRWKDPMQAAKHTCRGHSPNVISHISVAGRKLGPALANPWAAFAPLEITIRMHACQHSLIIERNQPR